MGGEEGDGTYFDSLSGDVLLLELASDMTFDEGGFAHSSVSDEDDFELCDDWFVRGMSWLHIESGNIKNIYTIATSIILYYPVIKMYV